MLKPDKVGVHVTHCCIRHGCKYSGMTKDPCPVARGEIAQEFRCEYCDSVWEDWGEPECSAAGCAKPGYWRWSSSGAAGIAMVSLDEVIFYFCDGHDEWHRFNPEWNFPAKPMEKRIR